MPVDATTARTSLILMWTSSSGKESFFFLIWSKILCRIPRTTTFDYLGVGEREGGGGTGKHVEEKQQKIQGEESTSQTIESQI